MKNISFCFQMHVPYRLKRYRFFDIGQDHYYYDDIQTEEYVSWLVNTSYLPLCNTLKELNRFSKGRFHFAIAVSGATLGLFEQFAPEMIDALKELAETKCVEFVGVPYAYSLASEMNENEFDRQLKAQADLLEDLFGQRPSVLWNTELLYTDEMAYRVQKAGYKAIMTEGAKHILSWQSPNYVYQSAGHNKVKLLLRNMNLSDELSFHFSDPKWHNFPMDAEKYAQNLSELPAEEELINIWVGAETFGILQNAGSGIFDFLRALPYYAMEREIGFVTPSEAIRKSQANSVISALHPLTWAGEAKDLSIYTGNDLQQEALNKLYAVAERVHLCRDKQLQADWLRLQDINYLHFMNHIDQGHTQFESAYDAFINYMNILADFLQTVEEQYPTTIENEELNELLKTIDNQEKEIESLQEQLAKAKKAKK
ncbi:MAG: glycoside hydrolase family 57 protein [Paludibacteraceae bacterium]|nr:glycoside hydrolase family 57 protein [Paludibacteraceae bacterium]